MQLGKHVYCEKPLTRDIYEARVIREAAAKANVVTQMGTQIHASDNYRRVVELIRSGAIGPVSEAHVWVSRAWGWQSDADARKNHDIVSTQERPSEAMPVPAGLDWDLWLGPAPARPFHEVYFPGPKWYRWWDFANGTMSDLGSHRNDLPFWALELKAPRTVEAFGPPPHPEIAPASMHITYEFGPRGDAAAGQAPLVPGGRQARSSGRPARSRSWATAASSSAPKGGCSWPTTAITSSCPRTASRTSRGPNRSSPGSTATTPSGSAPARTAAPTGSNFEYAGWLTETNHLGNVAYRAGTKLEWDPEAMRATQLPRGRRLHPPRLPRRLVARLTPARRFRFADRGPECTIDEADGRPSARPPSPERRRGP